MLLLSPNAYALTYQGKVMIQGGSYKPEISLLLAQGVELAICPQKAVHKLGQFVGWQVKIVGKRLGQCLSLDHYSLLETKGGRRPLIGLLRKVSRGFQLDGKESFPMDVVPKDLREHVGKHLVLDVIITKGNDKQRMSAYKLVTFFEFFDPLLEDVACVGISCH
jgi:hypothetical protein